MNLIYILISLIAFLYSSVGFGGATGYLVVMVGIGGGIFLSPIILCAHWGYSKQAATVSAAFIVLNSISGLVGLLPTSPGGQSPTAGLEIE